MASRSGSSTNLSLAREIGRMSEAMDRAREDRQEMKDMFEKLDLNIEGLRTGLNALNQTMQATAAQVVAIGVEKCGERLNILEGTLFSDDFKSSTTRLQRLEITVGSYEKWVGTGKALLGKIVIGLIMSAIVGGTMTKLLEKAL